ncbi:MAG: hypothetical protein Kow0062_15120 [Acidobacteriota bacterium]
MPGSWIGKARWASLRGDYAAAGDLYRLGGQPRKALRMYLKGRHHREAAELAAETGDFALASAEYERGGMIREAAEAALRGGDRQRAARLFLKAGQTLKAAQVHEQAGQLDHAAALYEHAGDLERAIRLYLEARKPDKAARVLDALLKDDPRTLERREVIGFAARCGQLLLAAGQPEQAGRWLERAGRSLEAARAWERAGRPERAIRAYLDVGEAEQAATIAEAVPPGTVDPLLAAEAFRAAGRWAEAGALYLEAGRPDEAALCLERLGCAAEAAWAYEEAGDLISAAGLLEQIGEHREAARLYAGGGAVREAARCYEACGDLEAAVPAYLDAGMRIEAAELCERLGQVDRAVEILQTAPPDPETEALVAVMLGRLFERKGMDSVAAEHYRRALADDQDVGSNLETWYRLAAVYERLGRVRDAIRVFRRVVGADVGFRDAARRLGALEQRAKVGQPGSRSGIPERYRTIEPLEGWDVGRADLAEDTVMKRRVVLRRFDAELVPGPRAAERILSDVRRVAQLHHPVIAAIHDAGREGNGIYLVTEHVAGPSLREVLARETRLDVPRVVGLLTRMAEALDYAHGLGLLCRTLRPETVRLTAFEEPRIVDFGLALRHTDESATPSVYRPPEARAGERMDPSSDIYLLGVLGWEMLYGAPPPCPEAGQTDPPEPPLVADDTPVPEVLRRVIRDSLVPDRARRLPSAQKLLEELHGTHLLPGTLLANRYEIVREIGRGGMGTVFQARDLVLDEPVALKVLAGVLDENTEKRFIQEIRLTRQINHPNIVRVHTFEHWRDLRFIVLEYIDGVDLRRWVERRHPIPLSRALEIVAGIAAGLSAAHRLGIVHRDVKPENVLLDGEGRPRLVDFGIARKGDVHLTQEGLVMGSPAYMAPEQIRGQAADQRADLYALGIVAFFLIAGREPFQSDNVAEILKMQVEVVPERLSSIRSDVPEPVADLIAQTLEKDPSRRPASVFAFLEQLTAVRARLPVVTA